MPILLYKKQNISGTGKVLATSLDETSPDKVATARLTTELNRIKAPKESPEFTGTPKAPTANKGTNDTQVATTAFVQTEITDLKNEVQNTVNSINTRIDDVKTTLDGAGTTVFNADGSIVTTAPDGSAMTTVFNADGSITETTTDAEGTVLKTKVTTFNADGSITETVS